MNGLYHVKQKDGNLNLWKNSKKRYSPVQKMAKLAIDTQISTILNDILRVEAIEEAFSCIIVYNQNNEKDKVNQWRKQLSALLTGLPPDQQEIGVKRFLHICTKITNHKQLQLVMSILEYLVNSNALTARLVCDCILSSEELHYQNQDFWILCFTLIHHIINKVDYKGIREIIKMCKDKAYTIPARLDSSIQPQVRVLENLLEYIFDRNACLLPSALVIDELQKLPDTKKYPHWKLAKLISDYIDGFRNMVQMISIIGHSKMLPVVEHTGAHFVSAWSLDRNTLQFAVKGNLPYDPEILKPQTDLLRFVLEQPYSRDMVSLMLGNLQSKDATRCIALEEQLINLIIQNMEKIENEPAASDNSENTNSNHWVWLHLSSHLIYFVLNQCVSFPDVVMALHNALTGREWRKSRDHLMWMLLQFLSASIMRKPIITFTPVFKLYDLLYPEKEPLPIPDVTNPMCTHQMAPICIWLHLNKKIHLEQHFNFHRPIPHNLKLHHEFLQHSVNTNISAGTDYRVVLLCNAYSTTQDYFTRPMGILIESVSGAQKNQQQQSLQGLQNNASMANNPTVPLSMTILDSLSVHVKMSLIHNMVSHIMKTAQSKNNMPLPPAFVETFSRLLVYTEMENLGIKKFISSLLPTVFKAHAWGTLYTLLDMFSYRMHHIQPTYRVQILSHLHSLASVPQTNQTQLHLCVESTALRLITGLGSAEVQPNLARFLSEPKALVSADSEELNRALVLTLARSMHVTGTGSDAVSGTWCKDLLNTIMQNTPHSWPEHTLQCFPPILSEFFNQHSIPKEDKQQLKKAVEEEYRNWASMTNENDIIAHFSVPGTPPLFLCLLWKMILETDRINPIAYKILERIGARAQSAHIRKCCDYIVFEVSSIATDGTFVNRIVDAINDMIWKYNIVTFDRLVLCLALRTLEGNDSQVCFFIIQLLLLKAAEFRNRVQEFVKENSPDHWNQSNWHEKHLTFHRKFPEKFAPEGIIDQSSGSPNQYQSFPAYFGNVCLRFIPILDIVLHRFLEVPQVGKSLEILLEHLGCLYRFHDRPVTYLYNTLHYYEKQLRDKPQMKRRLIIAILGSLREIRAPGWALSEAYQRYMGRPVDEDFTWFPELDYYIKLVQRLVETMAGKTQFPSIDWRFNEFPNPLAHTLYITCVELMALPVVPKIVANNLLDVVAKGYTAIPSDEIHLWINCIGVIMAALPESYWTTLYDRLIETVTGLTQWQYDNLTPFQLFNFNMIHNSFLDSKYAYTLALAHATWHHAGIGQMVSMVQFIKDKLFPIVTNEEQLIYACHLIGPTLNRFNFERPKCISELTIILYEMLEQINRTQANLKYIDPVCDLLYHIKYMFIGNLKNAEVDSIIRRLRPSLQMRLRFIAHLTIEEIQAS